MAVKTCKSLNQPGETGPPELLSKERPESESKSSRTCGFMLSREPISWLQTEANGRAARPTAIPGDGSECEEPVDSSRKRVLCCWVAGLDSALSVATPNALVTIASCKLTSWLMALGISVSRCSLSSLASSLGLSNPELVEVLLLVEGPQSALSVAETWCTSHAFNCVGKRREPRVLTSSSSRRLAKKSSNSGHFGGRGRHYGGLAVIDVGREACGGCWKQRGRERWRGNLRPQREAAVGELMRALVCVQGSVGLVWILLEADWSKVKGHTELLWSGEEGWAREAMADRCLQRPDCTSVTIRREKDFLCVLLVLYVPTTTNDPSPLHLHWKGHVVNALLFCGKYTGLPCRPLWPLPYPDGPCLSHQGPRPIPSPYAAIHSHNVCIGTLSQTSDWQRGHMEASCTASDRRFLEQGFLPATTGASALIKEQEDEEHLKERAR
ncbi:hypothetical protein EYF80_001727 [Liparis tanakae]|uniref:Uncharacterized protein n=1 Tax=Liparis tanakae TaxID=230148 RepID=A0A4Z2JD37_9TELE|nr:hypothetical protein EYF80_001727 [Liparis tanakae]